MTIRSDAPESERNTLRRQGENTMSSNERQPPIVQLWTRDGFNGAASVVTRPTYAPEYLSAEGPHVPRRVLLESIAVDDERLADALPTVVATSQMGVRLSLSRRREPMPFVLRNVEADEIHFVQSGAARFETDVGVINVEEHDLLCIPRSIAYRVTPTIDRYMSVIVESRSRLRLAPPAPTGMINFGRDVQYAQINAEMPAGGRTKLVLKTQDEPFTTFVLPHDPLALGIRLTEHVPVWKLNLSKIQVMTYLPEGGPPGSFLTSESGDLLMFNLSARIAGRPPIHINADFDELICYVAGPGAWGGCSSPGTLTCVPKGVIHHGPSENVPEGYRAWLLETRATMRWTPHALASAELMETGEYGPHPSTRR
jgi:homogentisate 1,2-dioxygenase